MEEADGVDGVVGLGVDAGRAFVDELRAPYDALVAVATAQVVDGGVELAHLGAAGKRVEELRLQVGVGRLEVGGAHVDPAQGMARV